MHRRTSARSVPRTAVLWTAVVLGLLAAACGTEAVGTAGSPAGGSTPAAQEQGAAAASEVTVQHAQGETPVPVNPETVITFDLGALDTLDHLGVEVAGVPEVASLPERLSKYAGEEYVKVGTLFEPDYEQVNALEPDLIIVAGRSSAAYPDLAKLAPTVDLTVDNADFLTSFGERLEVLGEIFGQQEQVAAELEALDQRIEEVRTVAGEAGTGLIVMTSGGEVSAYGPGSRFGLIHDVLGVQPAVEDVEAATHGDAISFEFILEANPDHLFVIDRDAAIGESGAAAQAVLDNDIVAQTTAWQQGDVAYLDGVTWYLVPTGLRSVLAMVDEVEAALQ